MTLHHRWHGGAVCSCTRCRCPALSGPCSGPPQWQSGKGNAIKAGIEQKDKAVLEPAGPAQPPETSPPPHPQRKSRPIARFSCVGLGWSGGTEASPHGAEFFCIPCCRGRGAAVFRKPGRLVSVRPFARPSIRRTSTVSVGPINHRLLERDLKNVQRSECSDSRVETQQCPMRFCSKIRFRILGSYALKK